MLGFVFGCILGEGQDSQKQYERNQARFTHSSSNHLGK
jgi:hypothetical protein